jgi:vacuolar-type H+-ATPase subunit H
MLQTWKETLTYLEGKMRGLQTLIGLISEEADRVIELHKEKVRKDIDFAYDKVEQYTQELLKNERQEG